MCEVHTARLRALGVQGVDQPTQDPKPSTGPLRASHGLLAAGPHLGGSMGVRPHGPPCGLPSPRVDPESQPMRVTIRNHNWDLSFVDRLPSGDAGEMDPIGVPSKEIRVALQQTSVDVIDTLIHELLHAALPDISEEAIAETATDIARVLHRLGVRVEHAK